MLAIITIHKGKLFNLNKTIQSVISQTIWPDLYLIISKEFIPTNIKKKFKKYKINYIECSDNSIFDAMNLGLSKSLNYRVLFLNSGDYFFSKFSIDKIRKNIKKYQNKNIIFSNILEYQKLRFYEKKNYFFYKGYLPHQSFISLNKKKDINNKNNFFDIKNKIGADQKWMKNKIDIYGCVRIFETLTVKGLGGISTNPTFSSIKKNLTHTYGSFFKEIIKYFLKKIFKSRKYYKLIYKYKYNIINNNNKNNI
jgi:hypothetical protein